MRLFLGLSPPRSIADALARIGGGIPGARWEPPERLHVTLRFFGEVDHGMARRIIRALERVTAPEFELAIRGVGVFPLRGPARVLWAGFEDDDPVLELRHAVDRVLEPLRLAPERRKFHAHVTLARLSHSPEARVAAFVTEHALVRSEPFPVTSMTLYSSVLSPHGSKYRAEAEIDLAEPE
jgi:2'-5' RNA ligase